MAIDFSPRFSPALFISLDDKSVKKYTLSYGGCVPNVEGRERNMKITRRTWLSSVAGLLAAGPSLRALAQENWPSRLVRLVSPYAAGGASDISLRILAEQIGRSLNQQFIVENKPG